MGFILFNLIINLIEHILYNKWYKIDGNIKMFICENNILNSK